VGEITPIYIPIYKYGEITTAWILTIDPNFLGHPRGMMVVKVEVVGKLDPRKLTWNLRK